MLDLDALLHPLSDDAPSGVDLEYDEAFIALEMASRPSEEKVIGDAVIPSEEPDYDDVIDMAPALLERSMDLRVAVILANAALRRRGISAFANVLGYIHRALETYWDSVHPQLDEDDGDPVIRVNAVLGLANHEGVLHALRRAPLVDSRNFGAISLRDIELASGEVTPTDDTETVPSMQTVSAAFQDEDPERLSQTVAATRECLTLIKAISTVFDDHIGPAGPDLTPLQKMVCDIDRRLAGFSNEPDVAADEAALDAPAAQPAPAGANVPGAINTPADVTRALDGIIAYYARCEPSSPLPILLERAKRLVSADFVTIMKDMAPSGVENVALIGGFPAHDDDY